MQIKIGWSAEINSQWCKLDVDVTDQDLTEFFIERSAEPLLEKLTPKTRFLIMTSIAEELILAYKAAHFPVQYPVGSVREELLDLLIKRKAVIDKMGDA